MLKNKLKIFCVEIEGICERGVSDILNAAKLSYKYGKNTGPSPVLGLTQKKPLANPSSKQKLSELETMCEEIAKKYDIPRSYVHSVVNGKWIPKKEKAMKIKKEIKKRFAEP